jgi:hypothetical protein
MSTLVGHHEHLGRGQRCSGCFEMAVGAVLDVSCADKTAQDVRNMLPLIVYQHSVWDARAPLARHWHSNLLAHLLRELDAAASLAFTCVMTGGSCPFHMLSRFKHTPP